VRDNGVSALSPPSVTLPSEKELKREKEEKKEGEKEKEPINQFTLKPH